MCREELSVNYFSFRLHGRVLLRGIKTLLLVFPAAKTKIAESSLLLSHFRFRSGEKRELELGSAHVDTRILEFEWQFSFVYVQISCIVSLFFLDMRQISYKMTTFFFYSPLSVV